MAVSGFCGSNNISSSIAARHNCFAMISVVTAPGVGAECYGLRLIRASLDRRTPVTGRGGPPPSDPLDCVTHGR